MANAGERVGKAGLRRERSLGGRQHQHVPGFAACHGRLDVAPHRDLERRRANDAREGDRLLAPVGRAHVARGRRATAQKSLMEASQFMQRWYAANNSYTDANGGNPSLSSITGASNYTISVAVAATGLGYTLTATRTGIMANDECGNLTLTSTGVKGLTNATTGYDVARCWK